MCEHCGEKYGTKDQYDALQVQGQFLRHLPHKGFSCKIKLTEHQLIRTDPTKSSI